MGIDKQAIVIGQELVIRRCYGTNTIGHGFVIKIIDDKILMDVKGCYILVELDRLIMLDEYYKKENQLEVDILDFLLYNKDELKNYLASDLKKFDTVRPVFEDDLLDVFNQARREFIVTVLRDKIIVMKNVSYEQVADIFTVEKISSVLGDEFFN